jgi:hypothetical protein
VRRTLSLLAPLLAALSFGARGGEPAADAATFDPVASVVMHPRCMNCHQADSPRQADAGRRHQPLVVRGQDGHGAPEQRCQSCHQARNTGRGIVPGAAGWHLAPASMKWEGLSKAQICRSLKDPARNGKRTGEAVVEHMKSDPLVLWAWAPGAGRAPPPLTHDQFAQALEAWIRAGLPCPEEKRP